MKIPVVALLFAVALSGSVRLAFADPWKDESGKGKDGPGYYDDKGGRN